MNCIHRLGGSYFLVKCKVDDRTLPKICALKVMLVNCLLYDFLFGTSNLIIGFAIVMFYV